MRILQRQFGEGIVNDRTYDTWKKTHEGSEEAINKAQSFLDELWDDFEAEFKGNYNKLKKEHTYRINSSKGWVLIADESTIITAYPTIFSESFSDETNQLILKSIINDLMNCEMNLINFSNSLDDQKQPLEAELNDINIEKESLNQRLKFLNSRADVVKSEIQVLDEELKTEQLNLDNIKSKLINVRGII